VFGTISAKIRCCPKTLRKPSAMTSNDRIGELRTLVAKARDPRAEILRTDLDAGRCVITAVSEVPAREIAQTYSARLASQNDRGDSLWHGLHRLVDLATRCGAGVPLTIFGLGAPDRVYTVFYDAATAEAAVAYANRSDYPAGHPMRTNPADGDALRRALQEPIAAAIRSGVWRDVPSAVLVAALGGALDPMRLHTTIEEIVRATSHLAVADVVRIPDFCIVLTYDELDGPGDARLPLDRALMIAGSIVPGDDVFAVAVKRDEGDEPTVRVLDWNRPKPERWRTVGSLSDFIARLEHA
jgi:hypothetical protein